ncbi:MAG: hypothetical protein JWM90_919 [Thermoleophilia bacterium]|nr:hypothetical protein [Thermoleophilia bacterium]
MNTTRLRYFLAICSSGGFGRAARVLHVSQPALSKAMRQLEVEVGVPLFARTGRTMAVTAAGRELARRVAPLVAELSEIPHDLATGRTGTSTLRFASHETFGTAFAARLSAQHGGVAFEHRYLGPEQTIDAVLAGSVDLGITYVPVVDPALDVMEVGAVALSTWGTDRFAGVPFEEWPYAAPARAIVSASPRPQGVDGWPDESIVRRVRYRVTHTHTALELCREGLAVAYLADFFVQLADRHVEESYRLRRLDGPSGTTAHRQPVYVVTRRGEVPEGVQLVRDTLAALVVA